MNIESIQEVLDFTVISTLIFAGIWTLRYIWKMEKKQVEQQSTFVILEVTYVEDKVSDVTLHTGEDGKAVLITGIENAINLQEAITNSLIVEI